MTDHTAPAMTDARRRMFRGSFYLFIIAETMIFVTLFSSRFLLAYSGHPDTVNQPLGMAVTALLVISLVPLFMGYGRIRKGQPGGTMLRWAGIIGVIALALVVYDWITLAIPVGGRYGENYVLSTGYHALHIVFGLFALFIIAASDARGTYSADNHWPAENAVVFWTFVVITWIILYVVFFQL